MKKTFWILTMVLLVLGTYGCRSLSESTPEEADEEAIETSIRAQVAQEYPGESLDIGVDVTSAGVVTLSGTVEDAGRVSRIEALARSVSGVTRVVNDLRVE